MPLVSLIDEELSRNLGTHPELGGFAIPVHSLCPLLQNSWSGSISCHWEFLEQQEISISSVPGSSQGSLHRAAPLRAPPAPGWIQKELRLDSSSQEWKFC